MRHRALPLWIFAALASLAPCAIAAENEPPAFSAPPECGTRADFDAEVAQRVGAGVELPTTSLIIAATPAGYHLDLRVGSEQRALQDADCRALFRAAVVVTVALTLAETSNPKSEERTAAPASEPASPPPSRSPVHVDVGLVGGVELGMQPGASATLSALGKLRFGEFGASLGARYALPTSKQDDERGVEVQSFGLQAQALYAFGARFELGLGASVRQLFGTGIGPLARDDSAWAFGPDLSLTLIPLRTRKLWLGVCGELHWNAQRAHFEILNRGDIFTVSPISGGIFLQLGPRLH